MGGRELHARLCALPGVEACTTTEWSVVLMAAPSTDVRLLKGRAQVVCADVGEGRPLEVHAVPTSPVPPAFPRPPWALLARAERPVALATASVLALVAIAMLPVSEAPSVHQPIAEVASAQAPGASGGEDAAASTGPGSSSYPPGSFTGFLPFADGTAIGPATSPTGAARPPATASAVASKQEVQVSTGLAAASKSSSTTRTTAARDHDAPVSPVVSPPSATEIAAPAQIKTPPPSAGPATELPICPVTPGPAEAASAAADLAADTAGVAFSAANDHKSKEPKRANSTQSDDADAAAVTRCIDTERERLKASPQSPPAAGDQGALDQPGSGGSEMSERGRRNDNGKPGSER